MTPLLIISDNPTSSTGLARITREIATRLNSTMANEVRVGVMGGGGTASRTIPYALYPTTFISRDYSMPDLPRVWRDFAGDQKGVVLTIWNHTWLDWLVRPELLPEGEMKTFLRGKPFEVWGYVPIDGERAGGTTSDGATLAAFDRLLAYTEFGSKVIGATIGREVDHLGHGNDETMFYPRSRAVGRSRLAQLPVDELVVGVCATNTPRKDWGLAFETLAAIQQREKVTLWAHTDQFEGKWDIAGMARFYKVRTVLTNFHMNDEDFAMALSACDVVLGVGSGEGWGLPLSESLAVGVPVVTGDYAGAPEFVPSEGLMKPVGFTVDGVHMLRRPVFDPTEWANRAIDIANHNESRKSLLKSELNWNNLWPLWKDWIRKGLAR